MIFVHPRPGLLKQKLITIEYVHDEVTVEYLELITISKALNLAYKQLRRLDIRPSSTFYINK